MCLGPGVPGFLLHPVSQHQIARDVARREPQLPRCADEDVRVILAHPQPQRRRFLTRGVNLGFAGGIAYRFHDQRRQLVQHRHAFGCALVQPGDDRFDARAGPGSRGLRQEGPQRHVPGVLTDDPVIVRSIDHPPAAHLHHRRAGLDRDQRGAVVVVIVVFDFPPRA